MNLFRCSTVCAMAIGLFFSDIVLGDVVFKDTFTDADSTHIEAHTPDVTSTETNWDETRNDGHVDGTISDANTYMVSKIWVDIGFTPLEAGGTLILKFETLGGGFGQSIDQMAGINLRLADGTSVFGIGDHKINYTDAVAGTSAARTWAVSSGIEAGTDDFNNSCQYSGKEDNVVSGVFTYEYDTGVWSFVLTNTADGSEVWAVDSTGIVTNGTDTYAPVGQAIANIQLIGNRTKHLVWDSVEVEVNVPKGGKALQLAGTSPEVTFNHSDLLSTANSKTAGIADPATGEWTCEFWIKAANAPASDTLITQSASDMLNIGVKADNTIYLVNNGTTVTSSAAINIGEWTHVAIVGNTVANGVVFINGVAQGNFSGAVDQGFRMSKLNPGQSLNALDVHLEEFRVWKTAKSGDEIRAEDDKYLDPNGLPAELGIYYDFNDTNSGEVTDMRGTTDGSGNSASSTNKDNVFVSSTAPIVEELTPALGLTVEQTVLKDGSVEISWSADYESDIAAYVIQQKVDGQWVDVKTVELEKFQGQGVYSVTINSLFSPNVAEFRLGTLSSSGYVQYFAIDNDDSVTAYLNINQGWNLISLPCEADEESLQQLNNTTSSMWSWDASTKSYVKVESPHPLEGIWVYSATEEELTVTGSVNAAGVWNLESGWNLVGPAENMSVPEEIETIYSWETVYQQILNKDNALIQGKGYWVYSSEAQTVSFDQ